MKRWSFDKQLMLPAMPVWTLIFVLWNVNATAQQSFQIDIVHVVGSQKLQLDSVVYKNALGQEFTVSKFKYYIGKFTLRQKNGVEFKSDDYFLVDEDQSASKQIVLKNVPPGDYSSLEFLLGVDSLSNCSGAQSGALDPANAMFWAWNTGYVFFKMEGRSPNSTATAQQLEYHVGGYRSPSNCIRTIHLELSETHSLRLAADLSELFIGTTPVDFSLLPSVTDHHNATRLADNCQHLFKIFTP